MYKAAIALLYLSAGHRDEPKQRYFPPRPTVESCLNVNLDPWFQDTGITHALATMAANSGMPETVLRTTARNLVLTQAGMVQDQQLCEIRTQQLFDATDICKISKRTQRSLQRRFKRGN